MKQLIQDVRSGTTAIREVPAPAPLGGRVVVDVRASAISAGTERYVVELARKSLLAKARQRPDDVKRVLQKMRQEGIGATLSQLKAKLDEPMALGYSAAGVVLECGPDVQEFKPGDRVAVVAPHADLAVVSRNQCAAIPDGVSFEQAAYTSIAAIGLQGVRLANLGLGDSVLVVGLGLIGQICVCLLKAQGCRVFGTDPDPAKLAQATALGADVVASGSPLQMIQEFSGSFGVDAAVLTAATESNEPIELAAAACRPKGRIVLVGVVGLNIPRAPFFAKELEFTVSFSLGPGRADPNYEEKGQDYPIGYARWTEQRNMEAVLRMIGDGKLPVDRLTSHRFPLERASEAYDLILERKAPFLGVVLEYAATVARPRRQELHPAKAAPAGALGVSLIGAGNFARLVMLPMLAHSGPIAWRGICTTKGYTAEHTGRRQDFAFATTDVNEIWNDAQTAAVFIVTRHDLHADLVIAALRAGKHVFVEKPLCISEEELARIEACVAELGAACPLLTVGFNRRFAPATAKLAAWFAGRGPLSLSYRFAAGALPASHWTQDLEVGGGRLVGEACHAIDTCVAIAGSPPVRAYAESVGGGSGGEISDDHVFITLRHRNGSISSISYQAGGDNGFPGERIEVLGGGRSAVVDAWDAGELWAGGSCKKFSGGKDKGHQSEFDAFVRACRQGGSWPIPWDDLRGVTWASLAAMRSLREGDALGIEDEESGDR